MVLTRGKVGRYNVFGELCQHYLYTGIKQYTTHFDRVTVNCYNRRANINLFG